MCRHRFLFFWGGGRHSDCWVLVPITIIFFLFRVRFNLRFPLTCLLEVSFLHVSYHLSLKDDSILLLTSNFEEHWSLIDFLFPLHALAVSSWLM